MKKRIFGFGFFLVGALLFTALAIIAIFKPDISFRALSDAIAKQGDKFKLISTLYKLK